MKSRRAFPLRSQKSNTGGKKLKFGFRVNVLGITFNEKRPIGAIDKKKKRETPT